MAWWFVCVPRVPRSLIGREFDSPSEQNPLFITNIYTGRVKRHLYPWIIHGSWAGSDPTRSKPRSVGPDPSAQQARPIKFRPITILAQFLI